MNTQSEMQAHAKQLELSQKALEAMADKIIADIQMFKTALNNRAVRNDRSWSDAQTAVENMSYCKGELSK